MRKSAEYFAVSVTNHDGAQHDAQDEKRERLQTIDVTQRVFLPVSAELPHCLEVAEVMLIEPAVFGRALVCLAVSAQIAQPSRLLRLCRDLSKVSSTLVTVPRIPQLGRRRLYFLLYAVDM